MFNFDFNIWQEHTPSLDAKVDPPDSAAPVYTSSRFMSDKLYTAKSSKAVKRKLLKQFDNWTLEYIHIVDNQMSDIITENAQVEISQGSDYHRVPRRSPT